MVAPRQCETYASLAGKAGAILGLETASPDPGGFHRAVDKLVLHPGALKGIETELQRLVEMMSRRQRSVDLRWHGRQLVAIDSSDLVLGTSAELIRVYGGPGATATACTVAHGRLSVAWDVRRKVILGWTLAPYRSDERAQLAEVTLALEPGSVVLLDRGYPSREVIALLRERDLRFIMRVPGGTAAWVCYRHLLANGSGIREASMTLTGDTIPLRVVLNP